MSPSDNKHELRREMLARLRAMSADDRASASLQICRAAAEHPDFRRANCVGVFSPLPTEPDIRPLIEEAWAQRKRVAFPLMLKNKKRPELDWHEVADWSQLVKRGQFDVLEPNPLGCPRLDRRELECVLVPGLAVDAAGYRLGRGGGFYDSFLEETPKSLIPIGLFFEAQQVAQVPVNAHDVQLQNLITERGTFTTWLDCNANEERFK